ncbi:ATP-grasp domain-containing protein [Humibacter soli]
MTRTNPTRVLVTGAGGPAGVAVIRSLLRRSDAQVYAGDMDGWASGLYLVDAARRRLLLPGASADFVSDVARICAEDEIDVLISTVDVELPELARRRDELGAVLAAPSTVCLETALDKWLLVCACASSLRVPATRVLDATAHDVEWEFPVIVKPRRGAGSRGVRVVADRQALDALGVDESLIVQEFLPGEEYSVDVLVDGEGNVAAAVPRTRARVDSGVSIAGRTIRDEGLESAAAAAAKAIGLTGVANVQLRRDSAGVPALLEINPRFPGALPLTIAAGVDMPSFALDLALGISIPRRLDFIEIANVRYLEDVFLDPADVLSSPYAAHEDE